MSSNKIVGTEYPTKDRALNRFFFKYIFYLTLKLRREWFLPELRDLQKSQYWSREQLERKQLEKLRKIVSHARENIPYYQEKIPLEINRLADIRNIPLLDKDELRNHSKEFMWNKGLHQRLKTSGGSTGAPISLLKDSSGMSQEMAATWRGYNWAGVNIGDRQARFWGLPRGTREKWRSRLIDFVCNRIRITAFNYDRESFEKAHQKLIRFKPDYFYGYVSIIREFAQFLEDAGKSLPVKTVITTSEVLSDTDRELISRVFQAKVFDEYGCGEVGTIAHECELGGRHLNSENVLIEIINEKGEPVEEGTPGEIVVTDLTNFSMPLLRYRIKDWASISRGDCLCGRSLPILQKIHGRQYDSLENSLGKRFHGEFFLYIAEDAKKLGLIINGLQFTQYKDLSIEVHLVCATGQFSQISKYFDERLTSDFDRQLQYQFKQVDRIEREPSGKLRVVKKVDE